jgi:hypothetical protein
MRFDNWSKTGNRVTDINIFRASILRLPKFPCHHFDGFKTIQKNFSKSDQLTKIIQSSDLLGVLQADDQGVTQSLAYAIRCKD